MRKVMTAGLEMRTTSAKIDREITFEQHARDKLMRNRDFLMTLTNNANFLQLNILATIIDGPLGQSRTARNNLNANRLNVVSGLTVGGLAGLAFIEQRGGIRKSKAQPNMLAQPLGLAPPADKILPPLLWTYLNSVPPESKQGLTRRELLIEYWKTAKILSVNIKNPANIEKISVLGPRHRWRCESIKLIDSRVIMLNDLRAMTDLLNTGLVELLQALD